MRKITAVTVEGASGSSSVPCAELVRTVIDGTDDHYICATPTRRAVRATIDTALHTGAPVLLVAKSLGAIRVAQYLRDSTVLPVDLAVVLIDPHSIGYGARRAFDLRREMIDRVINLYQRDSWPRGCSVDGAQNRELIGVDHFTIVQSIEVRTAVSLRAWWLRCQP